MKAKSNASAEDSQAGLSDLRKVHSLPQKEPLFGHFHYFEIAQKRTRCGLRVYVQTMSAKMLASP